MIINIEGHGRSWKVMEGQGRSRKVINGLFPSLDSGLTFQVRKVMGGWGVWWWCWWPVGI